MEHASIEINGVQNCIDHDGNTYIAYLVRVTMSSPYHTWEIRRRFSEFMTLYNYITEKSSRYFNNSRIYNVSFMKHMKSLLFTKELALKRMPILKSHLMAYLSLSDLSSDEKKILKAFVGFEEYENFIKLFQFAGDSLLNSESVRGIAKNLFPSSEDDDLGDESNRSQEGIDCKSVSGDSIDKSVQFDEVLRITCESFETDFRPTIINNSFEGNGSAKKKHKLNVNTCFVSNDNKTRAYVINAEGLKEAIKNNDMKAVVEVLRRKPFLAQQNDMCGTPPIYTAAIFASIDIAKVLIHHGANPYATNQNGVCAMDVGLVVWKNAINVASSEYKQKESSDIFETSLSVGLHGVGLILGKSEDNKAVIIGFRNMPFNVVNPSMTCVPGLAVCDRIVEVNSEVCLTYLDAIAYLKNIPKSSVVLFKMQRLRKQNVSSSSNRNSPKL